jgi:hypothetical protein
MNAFKFWSLEKPLTSQLARLAIMLMLIIAAVKGIIVRYSAGFQGDELFYTREVQRLNMQGLLTAMTEGISLLYATSGWLLSRFTGDILLANRILSLISLAVLVHALLGISTLLKVRQEFRLLLILTLLTFAFDPSRSPFLFGVNDTMLYALFFQSVYFLVRFIVTDNKRSLIIAAILAGACFWLREFALMYLVALMIPVVIWCFSTRGKAMLQRFLLTSMFLLIAGSAALLPHIPSLTINGTTGFEDKNYMGNWLERAYLSQVRRIPSGSVFAYQWVDWSEVEAYKAAGKYPPLPGTRLELLKRDPKMFADSFASNIVIRCTYLFTLRNGVFFLAFMFLPLASCFSLRQGMDSNLLQGMDSNFRKGKEVWLLLTLFTIAFTIMISVVSIHRIEIRWLTPAILSMAAATTILLEQAARARFRWLQQITFFQYLYLGVFLLMILIR